MRIDRLILTGLMAAIAAINPLSAQEQPSGGVPAVQSSLAETYEDWRVACLAVSEGRRCALSQGQFHESGKRVLAMELRLVEGAGLHGKLALPFGLYLDKGVALGVDGATGGEPSRFDTCLPVGCIVALAFNEETVKLLRRGKMLKLVAFASDTEKEVSFSVSLKGFATALDRVIKLSSGT